MFSWNTPIKLFPPQNVAVNSTYFSLYPYFCEFSSNSLFCSISRLGEEFFTRSSYDQNFFRIKKYEVRAFQRRVERTCSPLQCWDILSWTSKSHSTLSFGERFHLWTSKPSQNWTEFLNEMCGQFCRLNPYWICEHLNRFKIGHNSLPNFVA